MALLATRLAVQVRARACAALGARARVHHASSHVAVQRSGMTGSRFMAAAADAAKYDVVVVGGGPGGYVAAIKAAQLGLRTACVEGRGKLGGTCLNVGCIPSKALLHASHMYAEATHTFPSWGVNVTGVSVDLGKMMAQKEKSVSGLTGGVELLLKKNKVDYVKGWGKITGANEVTAILGDGTTRVLPTRNTIIATGSEVTPLPSAPVDNAAGRIVDSTGALALKSIPKSMIVIGGGVIGLELGSVWGRLGAKVTVVEFMDKIVPTIDNEIGTAFSRILKKQGFEFLLSTKVTATKVSDTGVAVTVEPAKGGPSVTLNADVVLVATGRRAYTAGLGLKELGLENAFGGCAQLPSIFAIGDVIAGPMLAHKAEDEGVACAEIIAGKAGHVNYDAIPGVVYTSPEVATVGKTEEELKAAGVKYRRGVFPMQANSRARTNAEADGLVKILADAATDRVLGVHIICSQAGEMIAEAVLAMEYGASSEDIARTCHAHPTLSEAVKEAAMATYDKPIHM